MKTIKYLTLRLMAVAALAIAFALPAKAQVLSLIHILKHSLPWAVLALKSVAGSWTCPKALPVFLKKQA